VFRKLALISEWAVTYIRGVSKLSIGPSRPRPGR
jgi:hypothetical protein